MYSVSEFETLLKEKAQEMRDQRPSFYRIGRKFLQEVDKFMWIHQQSWRGLPVMQTSNDLMVIQEIIFKTKPQYIIECGVAFGGGTLFLADMQRISGVRAGLVFGIDLFIPPHLEKVVRKEGLDDQIMLIERSSLDEQTILGLSGYIGAEDSVLVILDSNHTHEHVKKELEVYADFIGKDNYLIVADTWVDEIEPNRPRDFGPGNSPRTALNEFLKTDQRFERDEYIQNKLIISTNPDGYLKRVK